jgi:hypothetical protein
MGSMAVKILNILAGDEGFLGLYKVSNVWMGLIYTSIQNCDSNTRATVGSSGGTNCLKTPRDCRFIPAALRSRSTC